MKLRNTELSYNWLEDFSWIESITIEDVANTLSKICRFNGHTNIFYSVAEHCVKCSYLSDNVNIQKLALMHDVAEYVIGDIIRPLKSQDDIEIEKILLHQLLNHFKIKQSERLWKIVNEIDDFMLSVEMKLYMTKHNANLKEINHNEAKKLFLARYYELLNR